MQNKSKFHGILRSRTGTVMERRSYLFVRSVVQVLTAILLVSFLIAIRLCGGGLGEEMRDFDGYVLGTFGLIVLLSRYAVRRLPAFLSS